MITEGKYSVWFRTPIGAGAGIVEFGPNGELSGGDTTFSRMASGSRPPYLPGEWRPTE
jgi:hypothetical protein